MVKAAFLLSSLAAAKRLRRRFRRPCLLLRLPPFVSSINDAVMRPMLAAHGQAGSCHPPDRSRTKPVRRRREKKLCVAAATTAVVDAEVVDAVCGSKLLLLSASVAAGQ